MTSLIERLGFSPETRALIITGDGLGFSYGANTAIYRGLRSRALTTTSIMVPAPWARAAAAEYRGEDLGVQLVLNAELDLYRWGPITHAPSLLDGDGAFPRTIDDIWEHADLDEVRREWRAQIERAILWGFGVDHLSAHLGGVELKPEFFDAYLDLAEDYRLPIRLPPSEMGHRLGFPVRELAADRGVVSPDRVISLSALGTGAKEIEQAIAELPPGVTELHLRPADGSEELQLVSPDWQERAREAALAEDLQLDLGDHAILIGYRSLARLMRS